MRVNVVLIARRRAAARKMKQLKNSSKDTDDMDIDEDNDDYGELSGESIVTDLVL